MSSRKRSRSESVEGDHQTTPLTSDTMPTPTTSNPLTLFFRENADPTSVDFWQKYRDFIRDFDFENFEFSEEDIIEVFFYY